VAEFRVVLFISRLPFDLLTGPYLRFKSIIASVELLKIMPHRRADSPPHILLPSSQHNRDHQSSSFKMLQKLRDLFEYRSLQHCAKAGCIESGRDSEIGSPPRCHRPLNQTKHGVRDFVIPQPVALCCLYRVTQLILSIALSIYVAGILTVALR